MRTCLTGLLLAVLILPSFVASPAEARRRCSRYKRREARVLIWAGDRILRKLRCRGKKHVIHLYNQSRKACDSPAVLLRFVRLFRRCSRKKRAACLKARGYFREWMRRISKSRKALRAYRRRIKRLRRWFKRRCPVGPEPAQGKTKRMGRDRRKMAFVPSGWYVRGSTEGDRDARPEKRVYLSGFWIDVFEVPNSSYSRCVSAGSCRSQEWLDPKSRRYIGSSGESAIYKSFMKDDQPVVGVSWRDASAYCRWAGKRLPTEAEWEAAARGRKGLTFPWGENKPTCRLANLYRNFPGCGRSRTRSVRAYRKGKSPFGLHNMAGNVFEWVRDCYSRKFYARSANLNPVFVGSRGCRRVRRGGAWLSSISSLRTFERSSARESYRSNNTGFRCVRSLKKRKR